MSHIHEKIDFTASAFVVYQHTVLLRKHDKYNNAWLSVGGHIELDEDPNQAVIREVKEEVGLDIALVGEVRTFDDAPRETELIPPRFLNRHYTTPDHEHVDLVYIAITDSNIITESDGEKSPEIRWFTKDELLDPKFGIWERVQRYALTALEEAGQ